MKYPFFFDYIYYRMTKAYYKWDGEPGYTSLIGISMIQLLLIMDFFVIILRLLYERSITKNFLLEGKIVILIIFIILNIYNYRKHKDTYKELTEYWKNENKATRIKKGMLVLLALIIPWLPIILIGVFM